MRRSKKYPYFHIPFIEMSRLADTISITTYFPEH